MRASGGTDCPEAPGVDRVRDMGPASVQQLQPSPRRRSAGAVVSPGARRIGISEKDDVKVDVRSALPNREPVTTLWLHRGGSPP